MKNLEAVYYTELEPEIITLKSDKRYYVQGYISTIDKDLVNDVLTIEAQRDLHNQIQEVIKKGGFITGDSEHMVFYDENGNQLNYPKVRDEKGNLIIPELKFVESELRDNGVWVKAEVNKHLPTFKTIWNSIEDGFLNGFSVAINAVETVTKRVNNEMVNFISKLKLLNITMTGTPCNPNARMQPVLKSLIQKTGDEMEEDKKVKSEAPEVNEVDETKPVDEPTEVEESTETDEVKEEPKENVELKSAIVSLKSELKKLNSDNLALKTELKTLTERLEKIEKEPIKKSLIADKSKMLGITETSNLREINALDLI